MREVACDESGYEGEKLVGGVTDVFAHAGVGLSAAAATDCLAELRRRIRSPAVEYKANHLLREKNRGALEWFLGPDGPVLGNAHVHLIDKTFLLVLRLVEQRLGRLGDPAPAEPLYRAVRGEPAFLAAANDLLRSNGRGGAHRVAAFRRALDDLPAPSDLVERLRDAPDRPRVTIDPLVPAILAAADRWGAAGRSPVVLVHHTQSTLGPDRLALIGRHPAVAGFRIADSRSDLRIQVADFLAGVARKIASEALGGRGDAALLSLLRPYLDPASVWVGELP
ncbi:NAD-dependent protein deacetylase of SIR2 family [Pseudonocardia sp. TRM90224]|uniref:NAD-dependent protein deacetylase of SIR2 family n=1 Tax=Pseudonocardia sp. TRM90224 TaxID=2812678 RepID=UPI001E2EA270|nr:NAD-dependent protein deacetylase of SIR2 family [Pseudonocardia sp. TRM90224]